MSDITHFKYGVFLSHSSKDKAVVRDVAARASGLAGSSAYPGTGPADDIYATLVVRLHHTTAFNADQLWRFAADFKTQTGARLGFKLTREAEGAARLEIYFDPAVDENSHNLQVEGQEKIDNESRELILVGHAFSITAEAGQIYRGYTNSDHGIDGEIEFKDDNGHATGKRLYVQLKSGDSYLTERQRDGAEIFQIKKDRWATYWQAQAYPVMLVIRTSDDVIRWMDVSAYLKRADDGGKKPVKQIVFDGEPFNAMSVRRLRKQILGTLS